MDSSSTDKKYPYMFFTQVNRRVNPYSMQDFELFDSVNWWTERRVGAKKVRPGYKVVFDNPDSQPVKGLFYEKFPNGTRRLVRVSGKYIYAIDPLVATSFGSAKLTLSSGHAFVRPEAAVLNNLIHIVSKVSSTEFHYVEGGPTDTYTDTNYTSGTDPVVPYKALTCVMYHRRIYTADNYDTSEYSSFFSYSTVDYVNDGTSPASPWSSQAVAVDPSWAYNTPVDKDSAGQILKLTSINDKLQIYKEHGIYMYTDNPPTIFNIFGLGAIQGSIATMQNTKQDYFLTNEGFFVSDGNSVKQVGEGWYDHIKQMFQNTSVVLDPTQIHSFSVGFLYFCYLGTVGYDGRILQNACFVFNAYYNEMYLFNFGHHITCFGSYPTATQDDAILLGDVNGNVYQFDFTDTTNSDATVPISAWFDSKYYYFDAPETKNQLQAVYSYGTLGSEVTLMVDKDYRREYKYSASDVVKFGSKAGVDPSDVGFFKCLSIRFQWNGAGVRPEVWGAEPDVVQKSDQESVSKRFKK
jgi:hypothetical protein